MGTQTPIAPVKVRLVMSTAVVGVPSKKSEPCSLPVTLKALILMSTRLFGAEGVIWLTVNPACVIVSRWLPYWICEALPAGSVPPVTKSTWSVSSWRLMPIGVRLML